MTRTAPPPHRPSACTPHVPDPDALARPIGDPLGEVLHLLKITGTFYCQSRLTAPWGVAVPGFPDLMAVVVVTAGRALLSVADAPAVELAKGDLVLLPHGAPITLRSGPGIVPRTLEELPIRKVTKVYETLDWGGGGAETGILYGLVRIDHASSPMLRALLPDMLRIDPWEEEAGGWLQGTLQLISREARELRPGGGTLITRLADVVVIEAVRRWLDRAPEADRGWLKAARDPQIGRAIVAIHRAPAEPWTLDALAAAAGMSRSAFAARFTGLVGVPAMQYLLHWRMQLARRMLREGPRPIAAVAAELGYLSEPAFNRAFKRVFGTTPGQARRETG